MKKYIFIISVFLPLLSFAQQQRQVSDTVQVSFLYNVTVLFDADIEGDPFFGSTAAIEWKKVDARTVMVKADGQAMAERGQSRIPNTNMNVRTSKGYYNFILTYNKTPDRTFVSPDQYFPIYTYGDYQGLQENNFKTTTVEGTTFNNDSLLLNLNNEPVELSGVGIIDRQFKMKVEVTNIWVDSVSHYFKIVITNFSNIPYDINYFRYFTTYGKYSFKESTKPLEEKSTTRELVSNYKQPIVDEQFVNIVVIDKFTLNKREFFNIQLGEINGARQITVDISKDILFTAKPIKKSHY